MNDVRTLFCCIASCFFFDSGLKSLESFVPAHYIHVSQIKGSFNRLSLASSKVQEVNGDLSCHQQGNRLPTIAGVFNFRLVCLRLPWGLVAN